MRKKRILRGMAELERVTQMSEHTIRQLVEEGGFPAALVNGRWRAVEEDVINYIRGQINEGNGTVFDT
jgi:predicted DNA-binding transcriptional regulator AlpA